MHVAQIRVTLPRAYVMRAPAGALQAEDIKVWQPCAQPVSSKQHITTNQSPLPWQFTLLRRNCARQRAVSLPRVARLFLRLHCLDLTYINLRIPPTLGIPEHIQHLVRSLAAFRDNRLRMTRFLYRPDWPRIATHGLYLLDDDLAEGSLLTLEFFQPLVINRMLQAMQRLAGEGGQEEYGEVYAAEGLTRGDDGCMHKVGSDFCCPSIRPIPL